MQNYPSDAEMRKDTENIRRKAKRTVKRDYGDEDRRVLRIYIRVYRLVHGGSDSEISRHLRISSPQTQRLLREIEIEHFVGYICYELEKKGVDRLTTEELCEFVEKYWQDKDEREGEI